MSPRHLQPKLAELSAGSGGAHSRQSLTTAGPGGPAGLGDHFAPVHLSFARGSATCSGRLLKVETKSHMKGPGNAQSRWTRDRKTRREDDDSRRSGDVGDA